MREAPRSQCRIEVRDLYGRVRGRIEGPQGNGNPTGSPTVSTNLDLWEPLPPETDSPTKEHTQAGLQPQHICSRGLPYLALLEEDALNPAETMVRDTGVLPSQRPRGEGIEGGTL